MLARVVLVIFQLVFAWYMAACLINDIPLRGDLRIFLHAGLFGLMVWNAGLIGAEILQGVSSPSSSTLVACLIGALVGAALLFIPGLVAAIPFRIERLFIPLIGAVIGYAIKK